MVILAARTNLEQYFQLYEKTSTSKIKKVKSLLEQLRTWARNQTAKTKSAKSFRLNYPAAQVHFLENVFDKEHEKIIAFNVFIALLKIGAIGFSNVQLTHNEQLVKQMIQGMNTNVENSHEKQVTANLTLETFCFNHIEIEKIWAK